MIRHISLAGATLHDLDNPALGTIVARAIGLRGVGAPDRVAYPSWGNGTVDLTSRVSGPVISLEGECIDTATQTAGEALEAVQGAASRALGRGVVLAWTETTSAGTLHLRRTVRLGSDSPVTFEGAANRIQWQVGLVSSDAYAMEQPNVFVHGPALEDKCHNFVSNPSFENDTSLWSAVGGASLLRRDVPAPLQPFDTTYLYPGCAAPLVSSASCCRVDMTAAGDGLAHTATGTMTLLAVLSPFARAAAYVYVPSDSPVDDLTMTLTISGGGTASVTVPVTEAMHDLWVRIGVSIITAGADCTVTLTGTPTDASATIYVDCASLTTLNTDMYIDGTGILFGAGWLGTPHASFTVADLNIKYTVFNLPSTGWGDQVLNKVEFTTFGTGHANCAIVAGEGISVVSSASNPATGVATTWSGPLRQWTGGVGPLSIAVVGTPPPTPTGGTDAGGILAAPRMLCYGDGSGSPDGDDTTVTVTAQRAHV